MPTLPSDNIAIIDVPEVEKLDAFFVYNFFTPDERINREGSLPKNMLENNFFDVSFVEKTRKIPRMNKLIWKPAIITNIFNEEKNKKISIKENINKIYNEDEFTSDKFISIAYQEADFKKKYRYYVFKLLQENKDILSSNRSNSNFDIAKKLNKNTPETIKSDFLQEAFSIDTDGQIYGIQITKNTKLSNDFLEKIKINMKFNNKLLIQLLESNNKRAAANQTFLKKMEEIQNQSIASSVDGIDFKSFEFDIFDYVDIKTAEEKYIPSIKLIGYIIHKTEYQKDGTTILYDPIVIENPNTTTIFDPKIIYGSKYGYTIRSIYAVEVIANSIDSEKKLVVTFLISSKPSVEKFVVTEEFVPPPPPADFNITWDYKEKCPRITWSFPPNSQRDIKYFQIFKRKNIYSPFQLVKMIDFNDSNINDNNGFVIGFNETIDPTLISKEKTPTCLYLDKEFKKDESYIYTLACIDAHGFSSNYSVQYQIKFDKFANKIVKKLISRSGAPKAYPNMYLNQDTFVDTIRTSGKKKMKVYFNPEFVHLFDTKGNDLKPIKFASENGKYKLQIVNVDLQKQKTIDIFVKNKL